MEENSVCIISASCNFQRMSENHFNVVIRIGLDLRVRWIPICLPISIIVIEKLKFWKTVPATLFGYIWACITQKSMVPPSGWCTLVSSNRDESNETMIKPEFLLKVSEWPVWRVWRVDPIPPQLINIYSIFL